MEKIVLLFALVGSVGWIIDKVVAMKRGPDQSIRQRDEQIARLLEEIKLQKERMNEEIAKLTELVAQRDTRIIDLQSALQVAEIRLSASEDTPVEREQPVQQEIDLRPADPMTALISEAGQKAQFCLLKSKRLALAAVEANGREKKRLLDEAKAMATMADEYRAVANDKVRGCLAEAATTEVIRKAAKPAKARDFAKRREPEFEMVA